MVFHITLLKVETSFFDPMAETPCIQLPVGKNILRSFKDPIATCRSRVVIGTTHQKYPHVVGIRENLQEPRAENRRRILSLCLPTNCASCNYRYNHSSHSNSPPNRLPIEILRKWLPSTHRIDHLL